MNGIRNFPFEGEEHLESIVMFGLRGYASNIKQYETHVSISTVWFLLSDGSILSVSSRMHDLEGWEEVGSLVIELNPPPDSIPPMIDLPIEWQYITAVDKLIIDGNENFVAESGIRIMNNNGQSVMICTAARVYELALKAPFVSIAFNPEYDLDRYKLTPMFET